ncbi:ParB/RepB/Spo0J family partition protein [Alcaligenes faecalis]|uniref:ParB/RepB/Spo0J family partition protein n=1 Tax=Alcaligenes faecalis TaxID=511 RepID=UPI000F665980|nr:ParB/RepB/Spo0J family partition protein [Alcaligenes faecalis]RSE57632.1 ParB/RepB/Spo0J family partition protein [Alcaligenes faecalis]
MGKFGSLQTLTQLTKMAAGGDNMILTVQPDELVSEEQVRKIFRNLDALADSLETEGQQSPIIVSPRNKDGKYVIQKGERRWRAAKLRNLAVKIYVNNTDQSDMDAKAGQLIENIQRDNLTAMEIADALGEMSDSGMTGVQIAKRISMSTKFVSVHLSLRNLSEPVRALVADNVTGDADLLYTLEQIAKIDAKRCMAMCEQARANGITRKHAVQVYKVLKEQKAAEKARAQAETQAPKIASQDREPIVPTTLQATGGESAASEETQVAATRNAGPVVATHLEPQTGSKTNRPKDKSLSDNPFLTDEEKAQATSQSRSTEAVNPFIQSESGVVVTVRLSDDVGTTGRLLLDREPQEETLAWVRTADGDELEVEVSALSITSIKINA